MSRSTACKWERADLAMLALAAAEHAVLVRSHEGSAAGAAGAVGLFFGHDEKGERENQLCTSTQTTR